MVTFEEVNACELSVIARDGHRLGFIYHTSSSFSEFYFDADTESVVGLDATELGFIKAKMEALARADN